MLCSFWLAGNGHHYAFLTGMQAGVKSGVWLKMTYWWSSEGDASYTVPESVVNIVWAKHSGPYIFPVLDRTVLLMIGITGLNLTVYSLKLCRLIDVLTLRSFITARKYILARLTARIFLFRLWFVSFSAFFLVPGLHCHFFSLFSFTLFCVETAFSQTVVNIAEPLCCDDVVRLFKRTVGERILVTHPGWLCLWDPI